MSDTIRRVVTLLPGGQALEVLDLEDPGGGIVAERDTWKVTGPATRPRLVTSERRYAGGVTVGEAHDNGSVGGTWRVKTVGGDADDAIARWSSFIAACDGAAVGRHIEWRPDGATRSTFYEVRGSATWTPTYSSVQFGQVKSITIEAAWPVAPLALLAPMDVFDDFTTASESDYTFDEGAFG